MEEQAGLAVLDWIIIALYAISTLGLGVYYSKRQRSRKEYFVGSGTMSPLLIGVSLFATLLSTISYLSIPGEALGKGPATMFGLLAMPIIYFVVGHLMLPIYMKQRVTSAYELLEDRLGLSVRLLGATLFLALRLVWMTLLIYLAAKATTLMMGLDPKWVPIVVLITGLVAITYTTMGGLQAVVITDLMQTILLFGGALFVLLTITIDFGGFGWFPTQWDPNWDKQPVFSLDPKTRVTVIGTILSGSIWYIATLGGDQTSVQRFMATKDASAARRALLMQFSVGIVVQLTLCLVGFALLAYFTQHADALTSGKNVKDNADEMFPLFISFHLPIGISGLVVAAMFAAAMSSVDSGVNSITAVVMTDFLERLGWKPKSDKAYMLATRALALGIGMAVVVGSSLMRYIEGNITAVTNKTVNLLTTPIFALFVFALFIRNVRPVGVWVGAIFGVLTAGAIAFSGPLVAFLHFQFGVDPASFGVELKEVVDEVTGQMRWTAEDPISFQWIAPVALIVNVLVGWFVGGVLMGRTGKATDK